MLFCLYVLGGGVIQDFALALLIGVVVGTYSSIFVASPVLLLLPEGKPGLALKKKPASKPAAKRAASKSAPGPSPATEAAQKARPAKAASAKKRKKKGKKKKKKRR